MQSTTLCAIFAPTLSRSNPIVNIYFQPSAVEVGGFFYCYALANYLYISYLCYATSKVSLSAHNYFYSCWGICVLRRCFFFSISFLEFRFLEFRFRFWESFSIFGNRFSVSFFKIVFTYQIWKSFFNFVFANQISESFFDFVFSHQIWKSFFKVVFFHQFWISKTFCRFSC